MTSVSNSNKKQYSFGERVEVDELRDDQKKKNEQIYKTRPRACRKTVSVMIRGGELSVRRREIRRWHGVRLSGRRISWEPGRRGLMLLLRGSTWMIWVHRWRLIKYWLWMWMCLRLRLGMRVLLNIYRRECSRSRIRYVGRWVWSNLRACSSGVAWLGTAEAGSPSATLSRLSPTSAPEAFLRRGHSARVIASLGTDGIPCGIGRRRLWRIGDSRGGGGRIVLGQRQHSLNLRLRRWDLTLTAILGGECSPRDRLGGRERIRVGLGGPSRIWVQLDGHCTALSRQVRNEWGGTVLMR